MKQAAIHGLGWLGVLRYPFILALLMGSWLLSNGRLNDIVAALGSGAHDGSGYHEISRLDDDLSQFYLAARRYAAGDPRAWSATIQSHLDVVARRTNELQSPEFAEIIRAAPSGDAVKDLAAALPSLRSATQLLIKGRSDSYAAIQEQEFRLSPRVNALTEWADTQQRDHVAQTEARNASTVTQVRVVQWDVLMMLGGVILYVTFELSIHWLSNRRLAKLVAAKRKAMETDHLTGIANRMTFEEALAGCVDEPNVNVLYFDLDGFKKVNDWLGHDVGDKLLCRIAEILDRRRGPGDLVARFGGDEFAALLRGGTPEVFAEAVIAEISEGFNIDGNPISITASAGICARSALGREASAGEMMRNADLALYACKHQGRNQFLFCSAALLARHDRRLKLEADIEAAIRQGTLQIVFQPIMSIASSRIAAIEALVRWEHAEFGSVPAIEICELAKGAGQMTALTLYVMDAVCRFIAEAAFLAPDFCAAINLAPDLLTQPEFPDQLLAIADERSVDPRRIVLEVTEQAAELDGAQVARSIATLRGFGFRLAVDDFGAGQSNLVRLSDMDFSVLKFDKSLIDHVETSGRGAQIVEAISRLASDIQIETVAEGVETPGQLQVLRSFGVTYAQGYLISRPLSAVAALQFLIGARKGFALPDAADTRSQRKTA